VTGDGGGNGGGGNGNGTNGNGTNGNGTNGGGNGNGGGGNGGGGGGGGSVTPPSPYSQIDKSVSEPAGGGKKKKQNQTVELQEEEPEAQPTINRTETVEPPVEIVPPEEPEAEEEIPENPITGFFSLVGANLWAVIAAILFVLALLLYWKRAALAKMWKGGSSGGKAGKNSKHSPNGDSGSVGVPAMKGISKMSPTFSLSTSAVSSQAKMPKIEIFDPKTFVVPSQISVQNGSEKQVFSFKTKSTFSPPKSENVMQKQNKVEAWTSLPYLPLSNLPNAMSPTFSKSFE
jgi:hypothetical protein